MSQRIQSWLELGLDLEKIYVFSYTYSISYYIYTLQGINISHLGKRKIIFKMPFLGDMLVSWRVISLDWYTCIYIYIPTGFSHSMPSTSNLCLEPWTFSAPQILVEPRAIFSGLQRCQELEVRVYIYIGVQYILGGSSQDLFQWFISIVIVFVP